MPIIDNIIMTKKYYTENKELNEQLIDFWKKMIKLKGKGGFYYPHMINGWIVKFFPKLEGEKSKVYAKRLTKIRSPLLTTLLSGVFSSPKSVGSMLPVGIQKA